MRKLLFHIMIAILTILSVIFSYDGAVPYERLPVKLEVETVSDVYIPEETDGNIVREYPTIIKLRHQENEEDNGKLLASFEKWGDTYPIYISEDDAESWKYVSTVKDNLNEGYWNEWMPFLYELPADIGSYKKGTIILAATSILGFGENVSKSTITLYSSTDIGKTFNAFCNVDEAGGIDWGVWEPFLIYEEETGRLFCFYSDDSDPEHSQKLVYKYTTDLMNWSEKYECIACEDPSLRPGMISIAEMGNGEYLMVYEMVGISGNPIYCKRTTKLDDWGDIEDYGKVITAAGKTLGSSPYVIWSPKGGENGTLFLVAHHHVRGESKTGTDMFISLDYGKTYIPVANPLPYTHDTSERCSYSPSFYLSEDGATLYYANSVPCYEAGYKISVAKIRIAED